MRQQSMRARRHLFDAFPVLRAMSRFDVERAALSF
jgi:hypothetical protein